MTLRRWHHGNYPYKNYRAVLLLLLESWKSPSTVTQENAFIAMYDVCCLLHWLSLVFTSSCVHDAVFQQSSGAIRLSLKEELARDNDRVPFLCNDGVWHPMPSIGTATTRSTRRVKSSSPLATLPIATSLSLPDR